MPISHVGSNTQDSGGALSLTFTVPPATTTDDLMLVEVKQSENTTQRIWDDDGGGGNGYTRAAYNRTTSGRDQETAIYWKFATSGSEANPTFTWASGVTTEPMSGIMEVYRGVDKDLFNSTLVKFLSGTNDANPPNALAAQIQYDDSWVVVFHAATHDDISTVAAPTGFTLRSQIWNGTSNDHRNNFSADISNIDVADNPYTPPDWGHSVLNTTPEYHCYTVLLPEVQAIAILGGTVLDGFNYGDSVTVTGKGFGASQGTGKVELWDDTSGTTKTLQTVTSWSDTSITITTVQGSLPNDETVYVVVTGQTNGESNKVPTTVGVPPYDDAVGNTNPDHKWTMQNTTADSGSAGNTNPLNAAGSVGTPDFVTSPLLCDGDTHSLRINSITERSEIADSGNINLAALTERTMGGWIWLDGIQHSLNAIYEEGGGVNNICILVGLGNKLIFSYADTADDNVQAFSDFALEPGRPYHIMFRFSHDEVTKEFVGFIDGEEQSLTDGNPMTSGDLDSHSGDLGFGDPDGNLEVGGTDVAFDGQSLCYYSRWATWSSNSTGGGARNKTTEIRDIYFRRGALPDDTIASGTESAMQTALDATADARPNWPLSYRIESPSGGGNLTLELDDKVFADTITAHLEWRGTGTLTLVNLGTSNIDQTKCFSPSGGTISVVESADITITDLQNPTEVRIFDAGTTTELAGQENVTSGTFTANIGLNVTTSVDVHLISKGYVNRRIEAVSIASGDVGIPAQQQLDLNYENP